MSSQPETQPSFKIVSGGQSGVDRGALDAAIEVGIEHGGWCPNGRRAEDGVIPERYKLRETVSAGYAVRTEQNIKKSHATLILCNGVPTGGTALTLQLAKDHRRPHLVRSLKGRMDFNEIIEWLNKHDVKELNVAGPRESECQGAYEAAKRIVTKILSQRRMDT